MADPRAFISFDFDNNRTEKTLFVGQIKNSKTPFSVEDWSSSEELPQDQCGSSRIVLGQVPQLLA